MTTEQKLREALTELREWHRHEYQSNKWIDARVDAALALPPSEVPAPPSPQAECASLIAQTFDRMMERPPFQTICRFAGDAAKPCESCGKSWNSPDHQSPLFDPRTPR